MKYQMPEPTHETAMWPTLYTATQMQTAYATGRAAGLEEAAKVDFYHLLRLRENLTKNQCYEYHEDIESAIRNLAKEQPCES